MDKGQESTALHSALGRCGRNARVRYYCKKEETSVNTWRELNFCVKTSLEKQLQKEVHIASCYQWHNVPPGKDVWIRRQYSVDRSAFRGLLEREFRLRVPAHRHRRDVCLMAHFCGTKPYPFYNYSRGPGLAVPCLAVGPDLAVQNSADTVVTRFSGCMTAKPDVYRYSGYLIWDTLQSSANNLEDAYVKAKTQS